VPRYGFEPFTRLDVEDYRDSEALDWKEFCARERRLIDFAKDAAGVMV
jgi:hypothetical protein